MTRGIGYLIAAQFVSGLADNALLIVAIARLAELGDQPWMAPLLKGVFTLAYVVLAPLVGALADRWPKARVMLAANALKAAGCALMLAGADPLLAYGLAGVGAAVYSPAKYGLVVELAPPSQLVNANGWLEVTTVAAIILGTALGGVLVGPTLVQALGTAPAGAGLAVGGALVVALGVVLVLYGLAGALNLAIPRPAASVAERHALPPGLLQLLKRFAHAQRTLWRDALGGASLGVTTLFWGAGPRCSSWCWPGHSSGWACRCRRRRTCRAWWRWALRWARWPPGAGWHWGRRRACCRWAWRWAWPCRC